MPDAEQHGSRQIIGYDTTETLEFERPKLRVRGTKYPKFVCVEHRECGVAQPPRPASLLEDGYAGFESIALSSNRRIVRAACNTHARRMVVEAREYQPLEAAQLLAWYRQLYDIEERARGKSPEEVRALRRELSVPIMAHMRAWLDSDALHAVLPKSSLGQVDALPKCRGVRVSWER